MNETEWGFDAAMLHGRVAVEVSHYERVIKDLLVNYPLAPSSGLGTQDDQRRPDVRRAASSARSTSCRSRAGTSSGRSAPHIQHNVAIHGQHAGAAVQLRRLVRRRRTAATESCPGCRRAHLGQRAVQLRQHDGQRQARREDRFRRQAVPPLSDRSAAHRQRGARLDHRRCESARQTSFLNTFRSARLHVARAGRLARTAATRRT